MKRLEVGTRCFLRHKFADGHTEEYPGTITAVGERGLGYSVTLDKGGSWTAFSDQIHLEPMPESMKRTGLEFSMESAAL